MVINLVALLDYKKLYNIIYNIMCIDSFKIWFLKMISEIKGLICYNFSKNWVFHNNLQIIFTYL